MKNNNKNRRYLVFAFLLCFLSFPVWAQTSQLKISGSVVDSEGYPMPGVSIIVKEKSGVGTTTDINGNYSINAESNNTLVFSFVGFVTQEISVKSNKLKKVVLKEDAQGLEEVVVIAYGVQKKVTVTGAVSSMGNKELMKTPVASLGNALSGKITGVSSIQYSGAPGADDPEIYVRGVGSLSSGSSKPLILVDGVERSFTQIDPNEVADISILKDASATAVFGVRGANGVVLITTKRGTKGKAKVSLSTSVGFQIPTALLEFSNSYDYATYYNEAQRNDGVKEEEWKFKPEVLEAFRTHSNPIIYPDIDWLDYMLKSYAPQYQHNVNVSGGTDKVRYFVSLGYLKQEGLFETFQTDKNNNFNYNRYNYRANVDIDITKSTNVAINIGGRVEDRNAPASGESDIFRYVMAATPFGGAGIVDGKWITTNPQYIPEPGRDGLDKIYGRGFKNTSTNVLNLDLALTQKLDMLTPGLSLKLKGSYNSKYSHTKTRGASIPTYTPFLDENGNVVLQKNGDESLLNYSENFDGTRDWYAELSLNYKRSFNNHNVTGLLLYNQVKKYYPDVYPDIPLGYVGLVGRVTYDYMTKYMLDFNIGYNGSENFAPGKRYGVFPSASLGWVVSSEKFMEKQKFISYLKLRLSYGIVGNDNISSKRFLYLPGAFEYSSTGYNFGYGSSAYFPKASEKSLGNPNLTWEKARKLNLGLDLNILKDHLKFNVDIYSENRSDILITPQTTPLIFGISSPPVNFGKVKNQGFELTATWNDKIGKDFTYTISPNISYNRNEILEMDEVRPNEPYMRKTGRSVGQFFGYEFFGFYNGEETEEQYKKQFSVDEFPKQPGNMQRGDCVYVDLNGDGVVNSDDVHPIGYSNIPRITAGLNLSFSYKGFEFSMLWGGATQVSRKLDRLFRPVMTAQHNESMLQWSFDNRWTEETAHTATLPRASFASEAVNTYDSRLWIVDASYIRLRNIEIGYTFAPKALNFLGVSSLRFFANGYNLLTFTNDYPGGDPEQYRDQLDNMKYPVTKVVNVGLNVVF